jgi:hypothetical protein
MAASDWATSLATSLAIATVDWAASLVDAACEWATLMAVATGDWVTFPAMASNETAASFLSPSSTETSLVVAASEWVTFLAVAAGDWFLFPSVVASSCVKLRAVIIASNERSAGFLSQSSTVKSLVVSASEWVTLLAWLRVTGSCCQQLLQVVVLHCEQ